MADPFLSALTADVVISYVAGNRIQPDQIHDLVRSTYEALIGLDAVPAPARDAREMPTPADVKKSVQPEYLVSFIDGKRYRTIKRHLNSHEMTFEAYKAQFGLPRDYPSVCPAYSKARSELAKATGLGSKGRLAGNNVTPKSDKARTAGAR